MKNIKDIFLPALYFVAGIIFIEIIQRYDIDVKKFLDSGFFIALVTLSVGLFAIYLYEKQQNDNKRDAAKLIRQEIRYAEQQIRDVKMLSGIEANYYMGYKLLPTNSWNKNIHLFVNDLLESQIDLISNFYSQAAYIDELIKIISDDKNKMHDIQEEVILADNKGVMTKTYMVMSNGFTVSGYMVNGVFVHKGQSHLHANKILTTVTNKIEFIYNSPAVDKLKSISERKS